MELNIHEVTREVKFFGVYLDTSLHKYLPVIVSINEYGITEVKFYEELTERLS